MDPPIPPKNPNGKAVPSVRIIFPGTCCLLTFYVYFRDKCPDAVPCRFAWELIRTIRHYLDELSRAVCTYLHLSCLSDGFLETKRHKTLIPLMYQSSTQNKQHLDKYKEVAEVTRSVYREYDPDFTSWSLDEAKQ